MTEVQKARLRALKVSKWCARVLVAGAFALSAVALDQLAVAAHIPPWLAWIWPVVIDGSIYQSTTAVMALAGRTDEAALTARRWFQFVIGGGVLVSVAANALHAWTKLGHDLNWWQVTAVAIVPPILLLVATHGVTILGGLDTAVEVGEDTDASEDRDNVERAPGPAHITVERVEAEPVAEAEAPEAIPAPQPTVEEPQKSLEAAPADRQPRRPVVTQRDPERVLAAQQLAAEEVPVPEIADKLGVSARTVRRYLKVEVEETTVTDSQPQERPQLFAVADRVEELEVVNG
ncbi:DUF2637 domain-containing protein [Nocardia nova]|uniref:DUF2637 domain-containing protein n=1 Tax=Nocardia nova TaxID=37330 RepID=UPI0018954E2C|nr:DUF2637 domain-containing protein [Nocardia nova]MBF6150287.1 DUF2637 domain-containing protein [Nocardia nova]